MQYDNESTDVGEFLITARSFAEYEAMFALTDTDLRGAILDCPGGAAGFAAAASARGMRVVAADPVYATAQADLASHVRAETTRGRRWTSATAARFRWDFYGGPDEHLRMRREAAELFLADREATPQRYIAAQLPTLPFDDNAFDLVLSSHLLFTYADRLDTAFHAAALAELARVSQGEVRVYPLVDQSGRTLDALIADVRDALARQGIGTAERHVDFEFQHGATTMLVAQRNP